MILLHLQLQSWLQSWCHTSHRFHAHPRRAGAGWQTAPTCLRLMAVNWPPMIKSTCSMWTWTMVNPGVNPQFNRPGTRAVISTVNGASLGLAICYDCRFPELFTTYGRAGVEVLTSPSCFHTPGQAGAHWHALLRSRAIENGAYLVAAAQRRRSGRWAGNLWPFAHHQSVGRGDCRSGW